jgi:hypothetical protein
MTIVTTAQPTPTCAARGMTAQQRIDLALESLDQRRCVCRLADGHAVSRKFVYRQQRIALDALQTAFDPPQPDDPGALFHLAVTKGWLRQFVLAAVLVGHSSLRGTQEMLDCLLDFPVSLGWVHAVVKDAADKAKPINDAQDLSRVGAIAIDEIFQNRKPVLAVVDVESTYCCSLSQEDHRDGDTWGVRLLELRDRGLDPRFAIADGGTGLRAGLRQALPGVPCRADVWHPLRDLGEVARFLENRAYDAIETADKLRRRLSRKPGDDAALRQKSEAAAREQDRAIALADGVSSLLRRLRDEVLCVAGPPLADRRGSFDLVLQGLSQWRAWCEHRLAPVCSTLAAQKEDLLGFVEQMDHDVACLALYAKVSESTVREMVAVQEMAETDGRRWVRDAALRASLAGRYHEVSGLVEGLREGVLRGSGAVENLNSRLRNYFFLRKEIGSSGYLDLLRFFLNHRRFLRSEHPQRVGKSPAELLGGQPHAHWLELLGYQRFSQNLAA